ncbi:hypothetical protein BJX66DRAFT_345873 [Aspergillus keveii]|uniref:Uncharacterized protein n=1 Tax=Aspergillus keveii TaxID=714993 RepID=A0ABR4FGL6_9EURO
MEAHFKIWPSYFTKEDAKVRRGLSMISNERIRDWYDVEPIIQRLVTWEKFKDALMRMVSDPRILREDVVVRYANARQLKTQDVKECGLQGAGSPRQVEAINGHKVISYGNHQLKIQAKDKKREVRTQLQAFEAVDLDGYDAILGWTWLYEVNPKVN